MTKHETDRTADRLDEAHRRLTKSHRSPWTIVKVARLIDLAERRTPTAEIARRLGVREGTVRNAMICIGLVPDRPWTAEHDGMILALHGRGVQLGEIARRVSSTTDRVASRLAELEAERACNFREVA